MQTVNILSIYILLFTIYSFIGWFYESTICSFISQHKFINRGYLYGPLCPIYGFGAVINILLFGKIEGIVDIFVVTAISSAIIEYFTSYVMEKLFHARWWDYSNFPLNINGRICFYGCVLFGIGNVVIIYFIQPILMPNIMKINDSIKIWISFFIAILFITDVIVSTCELNNLKMKIVNINKNINMVLQNAKDKAKILNNIEYYSIKKSVVIKIQEFKETLKWNEIRFLKAFPNIKITNNHILDKVIRKIKERKNNET